MESEPSGTAMPCADYNIARRLTSPSWNLSDLWCDLGSVALPRASLGRLKCRDKPHFCHRLLHGRHHRDVLHYEIPSRALIQHMAVCSFHATHNTFVQGIFDPLTASVGWEKYATTEFGLGMVVTIMLAAILVARAPAQVRLLGCDLKQGALRSYRVWCKQ